MPWLALLLSNMVMPTIVVLLHIVIFLSFSSFLSIFFRCSLKGDVRHITLASFVGTPLVCSTSEWAEWTGTTTFLYLFLCAIHPEHRGVQGQEAEGQAAAGEWRAAWLRKARKTSTSRCPASSGTLSSERDRRRSSW